MHELMLLSTVTEIQPTKELKEFSASNYYFAYNLTCLTLHGWDKLGELLKPYIT